MSLLLCVGALIDYRTPGRQGVAEALLSIYCFRDLMEGLSVAIQVTYISVAYKRSITNSLQFIRAYLQRLTENSEICSVSTEARRISRSWRVRPT